MQAGRSKLLFETEKMRSPVRLGSREQFREPASARTYALTQVLSPIYRPDLTKTIFVLLACSLCSWLKRTGGEKRKKNTQALCSTKGWESRRQPTQDRLIGGRRGQLGVNINTACAVIAQQVIMITTCSLGGLSDLLFEHLPFLKSPCDNIRCDYKVKIFFKG